jgi:cytochrome bd-type quinol oxidase subunit 2
MLGLVIMAAMIYMALNKQSNFAVRLASIAAIFLMLLTIVICLIVALTDNRVPVDESVLIVGAPPPETFQGSTTNTFVLLLLILFLIAFFIIITIFSMREHRKHFPKKT